METPYIDPLLETISADIADFTIGFIRLRNRDGAEDADAAESGTLVTVGALHGILTAAHVLTKLPEHGKVGIVRFPRAGSAPQKFAIDMSHTERLLVGCNVSKADGPDLGFLRLSPNDVAILNATNVFFNLDRRREAALLDQAESSHFDGVAGVIDEWTTELSPERGFGRIKSFRALFGVGLVIKKRESEGFDLLDFEVTYEEGSRSPYSFGGMSGGALWRVYATKNGEGALSITDKKVFGIAFYQSEIVDRKRIITCHGPMSVYRSLIDEIRKRWPSSVL